MPKYADVKRLIEEEWPFVQGQPYEWGRLINPPGVLLHIPQRGLRLLVTDAAIEDNSPESIYKAIALQDCEQLPNPCTLSLLANLVLEVK